jgi:hypothetical protein
LFSLLDNNSSEAEWSIFQIIAALGLGIPLSTTLPSIQAALPESDTATSTATYSFLRSFGFIWGITIPSVVFNSRVDALISRVGDPIVQAVLSNGGAYSHASGDFIASLTGSTLAQTLSVYADSLKTVWQVGIAFSLLGFLSVFLEEQIELRTTLDTDFGLEDKQVKMDKYVEVEKGEKAAAAADS